MAKAKKQDTPENKAPTRGAEAGAANKQPAATKAASKTRAPAKGAANKPARTGSPGGVPLIDTSLAASAAASMVLNRAGGGTNAPASADASADSAGDKRETSTFKQLKHGLSKAGSQGLGGILGGMQSGKKVTQTFSGPNQVRRNQTFGADASRTNVPRRTGG